MQSYGYAGVLSQLVSVLRLVRHISDVSIVKRQLRSIIQFGIHVIRHPGMIDDTISHVPVLVPDDLAATVLSNVEAWRIHKDQGHQIHYAPTAIVAAASTGGISTDVARHALRKHRVAASMRHNFAEESCQTHRHLLR